VSQILLKNCKSTLNEPIGSMVIQERVGVYLLARRLALLHNELLYNISASYICYTALPTTRACASKQLSRTRRLPDRLSKNNDGHGVLSAAVSENASEGKRA
jgi:hypothetical protein